MSRLKYFLLGLVLIAIAGCSKQPTETSEQQPAKTVEKAAEKAVKKAAPQPRKPATITIPAGTDVQVRLQDPLDSSVNKNGDTFRAILDKDIDVDGTIVAPRGSSLTGQVSNVAQSGRVEGRAKMSFQLTSIEIGSETYPLQTQVLSFEAEATTKDDAKKVGIGAGVGAAIGALAGGGKGAAIGAAVGGGAGGATVLATRGKEVKFGVEHKFNFTLSEGVSVKKE